MASASAQSLSINMVLSTAIKGSDFLQISVNKLHTYAKSVEKIDLLKSTKFSLLDRNLKQLDNHLGHIRSQTAKISANPIRLDIQTSRNSLKEARKDMTAIEHDAKQVAFWTKKTNENLNKPVQEFPYKKAPIIDTNNQPTNPKNKTRKTTKNNARDIGNSAMVGAVGIIGSFAIPLKHSIDFESSMADITKATNADEFQTLKLKKAILEQSTKGSILTSSQMAQIQAGGGRSGVAMKDLPQFMNDISKASVAMDLSTEESGKQFAKMAERLDIPIDKINIMTNAFTHLENSGTNSAKDMINTTGRLSLLFKELRFKPQDGAAISNYMNTLEVTPELAASSFQILTDRLKQTNSQLHYFDKLKGGAHELKGIIKDITSKMSDEKIIKEFGSKGASIIVGMSENYKSLDKSLALVADNKFMSAVDNEYNVKLSTTGAKALMITNRIIAQSIIIGDHLKGIYLLMYDGLSQAIVSGTEFFSNFVQKFPQASKSIVILGTTFMAGSIALAGFGLVASGVGTALAVLTSPMSMVVLGVMSIAAAGAYLYNKFENVKTSLNSFFTSFSSGLSPVVEEFKGLFGGLFSSVGGLFSSLSPVFSAISTVLSGVGIDFSNIGTIAANVFSIALSPIKLVLKALTWIVDVGAMVVQGWVNIGALAVDIWNGVTNAIKSPFVILFDWIDSRFSAVMGVVEKVKNIASSVTGLFGFEDKPKILKAEPSVANNVNFNKKVSGVETTKSIADVKTIKQENMLDKPKILKTESIVNNISFRKELPKTSFLKELEIPTVPLESVSDVTNTQLNQTKNQLQNNTNQKQIAQTITNQITVYASDGKVDYEDLKEKLRRANKELAHDEQDLQFADV